MKRRELYKIYRDGKVIFDDLSQMEYFDIMEDLAIEFYQTGSPTSDQLKTETYLEEYVQNNRWSKWWEFYTITAEEVSSRKREALKIYGDLS